MPQRRCSIVMIIGLFCYATTVTLDSSGEEMLTDKETTGRQGKAKHVLMLSRTAVSPLVSFFVVLGSWSDCEGLIDWF